MTRSTEWVRVYCQLHRQIKSMGEAIGEALNQATGEARDTGSLSTSLALLLLICADRETSHCAQRELAELTSLSTAAVSGHLETLRRRGLVDSQRDTQDRRRQIWQATQRGEVLVEKIKGQLAMTKGCFSDREAA